MRGVRVFVRYGLNTLPNTPLWFGTNSIPVPSLRQVRSELNAGTRHFRKFGKPTKTTRMPVCSTEHTLARIQDTMLLYLCLMWYPGTCAELVSIPILTILTNWYLWHMCWMLYYSSLYLMIPVYSIYTGNSRSIYRYIIAGKCLDTCSHGAIEAGPTRGQGRSLGITRTTNNLREGYQDPNELRHWEKSEGDDKYGCDLMPQQRGLIDPKLYTN